jgi:uncharacterized protein (DUF58 family)
VIPGPLRLLTPRGSSLLVAAVVLWALARTLGVAELQMAAVAAAALVLLAVAWVATTGARLTVERRVAPVRLFHGARGGVELRVRNTGRLPTARLTVRDRVPDGLGAPAGFVLAPIAPGRRVRLRYEVHGARRGRFAVGPLEVEVRDPFGLAARRQSVGDVDGLTVYPPVHRLEAGLPLHGRTGAGGAGRPRPGTTGDELATVREYVRGDDLRRVHWGATAHRGELMIRQNESTHRPDALLVLDTRPFAHGGEGATGSLETATAAAASVAYHVAERGFDAALVTGATTRAPVPLPWEATLERLAGIELDSDADLSGLWHQLASGAGTTGVLLAVTCVPDAELLRAMVRAGRAATVRIALLVDAEAHERTRRARREPDRTAAALRAAGWRVAVVGPRDQLGERWRELLTGHRQGAGA